MRTFLKFSFFFAILLSWFRFVDQTDSLTKDISVIILFSSLIPILFTLIPYLVYLRMDKYFIKKEKEVIELKEQIAEYEEENQQQVESELEEGQIMCLLKVPPSDKGGKYSEGVYLWFEQGAWLTTLDFHTSRGGDPDVFNRWLEQEKENPKYLEPTLQ